MRNDLLDQHRTLSQNSKCCIHCRNLSMPWVQSPTPLSNNQNPPFILFALVSLPVLPDLLHHFASDGFLNFLRHLVLEHKLGVPVRKGNQVCGRCGDEEKQRVTRRWDPSCEFSRKAVKKLIHVSYL